MVELEEDQWYLWLLMQGARQSLELIKQQSKGMSNRYRLKELDQDYKRSREMLPLITFRKWNGSESRGRGLGRVQMVYR